MSPSSRPLLLPSILGAVAVAAGAFGAHALRDIVPPERLETWRTAANYHLLHAVALLALGFAPSPRRLTTILFTLGIVLFSGSLYALVLTDQRVFAWFTPLGGVCFIVGWLGLARGLKPEQVPDRITE